MVIRKSRLVLALSVTLSIWLFHPRPAALAQTGPAGAVDDQLCLMVESVARANGLPIEFFARLIWQESRFRTDEIGPVTRTGQRALGIAQFMPGTAIERGLFEPFNPVEALPKSGEFLAELRDEFGGNLGLATAAYNAGPQRVRDYIAGLHDLPLETRNYVLAITGHPIEDWMRSGAAQRYMQPDGDGASCPRILALLNRPIDPAIAEMELKVPHWCRYLEHPNVSVCGPVHERRLPMSAARLVSLRAHLPMVGNHRGDPLHVIGLRH